MMDLQRKGFEGTSCYDLHYLYYLIHIHGNDWTVGSLTATSQVTLLSPVCAKFVNVRVYDCD